MQGRDEEQVRQVLAALRRSMEPVQAPPELEARLLAAYRRPPWWKRARVYGAVAATLLLGAAGWTWSVWRQPLPRLAGYPPVRAPLPPERPPSAPHGERPAARASAARKPAKPVRWQDAPPAPVREEVVPAPRFEGTPDARLTIIFINDPVAGVHYVVDPQRKEVRKMARIISIQGGGGEAAGAAAATPGRRVIVAHRQIRIERDGPGGTGVGTFEMPAPAPGGDFLMLMGDPGKIERRSEPLGTRPVEGVLCEGTRVTETMAAGAMGNERPIVSVSERWYSPELQTTVLSKRTDPRFGETTYKLVNLDRAEPPAAQFEPPPGYQVIDAGSERIRIEHRFEPK